MPELNLGKVVGADGPTGKAGPTGDIGPQGLKGDAGPQGVIGDKGNTGSQGLVGATGPRGLQGPQGLIGATGSQGLQGATGQTGVKGDTGAQGTTGKDGINGKDGALPKASEVMTTEGTNALLTITETDKPRVIIVTFTTLGPLGVSYGEPIFDFATVGLAGLYADFRSPICSTNNFLDTGTVSLNDGLLLVSDMDGTMETAFTVTFAAYRQ